jgi:acetyl/propionyl-CoA carboxylase alpha subunit
MNTEQYHFLACGKRHTITLRVNRGKILARLGAKNVQVSWKPLGESAAYLYLNNSRYLFTIERTAHGLGLTHAGDRLWLQKPVGARDTARAHALSNSILTSPMPGIVTAICVKNNQVVQPGKTLLVIEAMKMQNPLKASAAGRVKTILVATGTFVEAGQPVISMAHPR